VQWTERVCVFRSSCKPPHQLVDKVTEELQWWCATGLSRNLQMSSTGCFYSLEVDGMMSLLVIIAWQVNLLVLGSVTNSDLVIAFWCNPCKQFRSHSPSLNAKRVLYVLEKRTGTVVSGVAQLAYQWQHSSKDIGTDYTTGTHTSWRMGLDGPTRSWVFHLYRRS
jgi:hypothetical protein